MSSIIRAFKSILFKKKASDPASTDKCVPCVCGAYPDLKTRIDGEGDILFRLSCPGCGKVAHGSWAMNSRNPSEAVRITEKTYKKTVAGWNAAVKALTVFTEAEKFAQSKVAEIQSSHERLRK